MAKINGFNVLGVLLPPMSGRSAIRTLRSNYGQTLPHAMDAMRTCMRYGICAKQTGVVGEFVAVYPRRTRTGFQFVIEDGTSPKIIRADRPERVARARPIGYSSTLRSEAISVTKPTNKEPRMAARTAARPAARSAAKAAPAKPAARVATKPAVRKGKAAPEPEPEDLELEELEDEELDDEEGEDEELDDELEDEDDEDEDEDEEDEEEDDEDDEDDESEVVDYTPYADKAITDTMADFAEWIDAEIFQPTGTSIQEVGAEDPVRLIAIAGTVRMEFQRSDFNKERRLERQAEKAAARAKPVKVAVAKKPVATAKPTAKVAARPAKPVAKVATKVAARPAKPVATRTASVPSQPRSKTRQKGPAPY